jgi:hypothetical protein
MGLHNMYLLNRNGGIPVIDILVDGESGPVGEVCVEGGEPGRTDAHAAVHHKLRQQGVQLLILHQRLVLPCTVQERVI